MTLLDLSSPIFLVLHFRYSTFSFAYGKSCYSASFVYYFSDYDALRALDSDNPPDAPSMTEEEINSLPVHKYKLQSSNRQRQDPILYLYIGFVFSKFSFFNIFRLQQIILFLIEEI